MRTLIINQPYLLERDGDGEYIHLRDNRMTYYTSTLESIVFDGLLIELSEFLKYDISNFVFKNCHFNGLWFQPHELLHDILQTKVVGMSRVYVYKIEHIERFGVYENVEVIFESSLFAGMNEDYVGTGVKVNRLKIKDDITPLSVQKRSLLTLTFGILKLWFCCGLDFISSVNCEELHLFQVSNPCTIDTVMKNPFVKRLKISCIVSPQLVKPGYDNETLIVDVKDSTWLSTELRERIERNKKYFINSRFARTKVAMG